MDETFYLTLVLSNFLSHWLASRVTCNTKKQVFKYIFLNLLLLSFIYLYPALQRKKKDLRKLWRHREVHVTSGCLNGSPLGNQQTLSRLHTMRYHFTDTFVFPDSPSKGDNSRLCTSPVPWINLSCSVAPIILQVFIPMSVSILGAGPWLIYFCTSCT